MRLTRSLIAAAAFLVLSCRHGRDSGDSSETAGAPDACKSQGLSVLPWNVDSAVVEEEKYRHLVKEISDQLAAALIDKLALTNKFDHVAKAAECSKGIRLEGRVVSLIHSKRQYHYKVTGRIVDCATDKPLHLLELEEITKEVADIAPDLAGDMTRQVERDFNCPAVAAVQPTQPAPPPPAPTEAPPTQPAPTQPAQ